MNCPVCDDVKMREVEKDGIAIDVCPSCKGVWLDRGELDKLMQGVKEVRQEYNQWYYDEDSRQKAAPRPEQYQQRDQYPQRDQYQSKDQYKQGYGSHKHKKKKSVMDMFGDLFD
jgi:Zn-finger nucleic acid-binding protein